MVQFLAVPTLLCLLALATPSLSADPAAPDRPARAVGAPSAGTRVESAPPSASEAKEAELRKQLAAGEEANRTGNGPEAVERFQAALDLSEALCDERSTGDALEGLGVARWLSGDSAAALEPLREALVIRQRLGQTAEEALNWNDIGLSNYSLARYPEALDAYRRALEVDAYAPSARLEGVATMNIGLVYRFLAHYGDAEEWMERSLAIRRGQGNPAAIGQTLNALGLVARARGRFAKALDLYAEALPLRREGGDRQGEAQTLNGIGVVLMDLGQFEEAKPRFQESLVIAKKIGYKAQIGFAAWNIGVCLTHLGHEREGLERYDEALAVWKKLGRRAETARTLSQLGDVCIQLGDLEAARANLEESLAIAREIGEPDPEASDLDSLGVLDLRAGRPSEALARMDAALSLARTNTMPDIEWQVQADRARALRALGRDPEAVEALRASVRLIDDLRAEVRTDPGKIGFLEQRRRAFEDLVEALTRAGLPQEALEVAEACRARALADLLGQRGGAPHPDAREALEDVRQALEETRATPLPTGDAAVAAGARGAPDRVDAALSRLRKRDPELASLLTVETPTGEDIRQAVSARRGTLVEYLLTEDRLFLWSLSPEGELHEESLEAGRGRLASLVQAVLADMNRSSPAARRDAARRLRELDRLLIEPVARWLPARPEELLIVAPQGILSLLPFAALLDRSGRTLLERHTLVVVPAVSVLRYTANKGRHSPGLTSALVVADPVPPRGSGLERLAGARREGALVAAHFPESRRDVLTGAAATEAAVKSRSGGREVLHFATHGLVSDRRPLDSALLLAEGEGEDGYLRADEIFGLVLHADLVVLSGCSTGLGEVTGEGILGLTRAFLYAGTPSVVVSQWDVDDRATTFLMDRFYANLQAGHGKAEALRAAQLEAQRRFRDPALWAGFELVGEP